MLSVPTVENGADSVVRSSPEACDLAFAHPLLTRQQEYVIGETLSRCRKIFLRRALGSPVVLEAAINAIEQVVQTGVCPDGISEIRRAKAEIAKINSVLSANLPALRSILANKTPKREVSTYAELLRRERDNRTAGELIAECRLRLELIEEALLPLEELKCRILAETDPQKQELIAHSTVSESARFFLERMERIRKARTRMIAVRTKLVAPNLKLIVAIAKGFRNRGLSMADLIQEGVLGLIRAADRFDYRLGTKFSTSATYWIKKALISAIEEERIVRLSVSSVTRRDMIQEAECRLSHYLGRRPTPEEIAEHAGLTAKAWNEYARTPCNKLSLDCPEESNLTTWANRLPAPKKEVSPFQYNSEQTKRIVGELLNSLDRRERAVIVQRYGLFGQETRTYAEIARRLNLSAERARQIANRATDKMRKNAALADIFVVN